ncbi:hypothetical protein BT69DRAFT_1300549 [Atractiella rhizophila]|nr:hypothetical protein BT69DRAFT_1300549 [Atractiella rhizophila]
MHDFRSVFLFLVCVLATSATTETVSLVRRQEREPEDPETSEEPKSTNSAKFDEQNLIASLSYFGALVGLGALYLFVNYIRRKQDERRAAQDWKAGKIGTRLKEKILSSNNVNVRGLEEGEGMKKESPYPPSPPFGARGNERGNGSVGPFIACCGNLMRRECVGKAGYNGAGRERRFFFQVTPKVPFGLPHFPSLPSITVLGLLVVTAFSRCYSPSSKTI